MPSGASARCSWPNSCGRESRGRALGIVQSAWAAGWALAVVAYLITFELFDETVAWRVLMCLGILPALLILYVRSRVEDPKVYTESRSRDRSDEVPLKQILQGKLLRTTIAASRSPPASRAATTRCSRGSRRT